MRSLKITEKIIDTIFIDKNTYDNGVIIPIIRTLENETEYLNTYSRLLKKVEHSIIQDNQDFNILIENNTTYFLFTIVTIQGDYGTEGETITVDITDELSEEEKEILLSFSK